MNTDKNYPLKIINLFVVWLLVWVVASCDSGNEVRKYQVNENSETQKASAKTGPKQVMPDPGQEKSTGYRWQKPESWIEIGEPSSMRLAAFRIPHSQKEALCTIIPLKGNAGGLQANVSRWMGQIGVDMDPHGEPFQRFLAEQQKFTTTGNLQGLLVDLTSLTQNPTDKSIITAIISSGSTTVFIKMTGEKAILEKNREKFQSLYKSFRTGEG